MKKLHFEIEIEAPPEKVWDATINPETYREWTMPFSPKPDQPSFFEGGWNTGDKIRFVSLNDNGEKEGMASEIAESRKPEFLSIRHLGYILNGQEDTESDSVKAWSPAYENYTLERLDGRTRFLVDLDVEDRFAEMFGDMWPKALQMLKRISERK